MMTQVAPSRGYSCDARSVSLQLWSSKQTLKAQPVVKRPPPFYRQLEAAGVLISTLLVADGSLRVVAERSNYNFMLNNQNENDHLYMRILAETRAVPDEKPESR